MGRQGGVRLFVLMGKSALRDGIEALRSNLDYYDRLMN
jgi:hypothetical protein